MSRAKYLAYRLGWTVVGAWAALTVIFLVFELAPDPGQYDIFNGLTVEEYRAMRGYDQPMLERYLGWMTSLLTLDLGTTVLGQDVRTVLGEASLVTLVYLIPSILVSVTLGVGVGVLLAMRTDSRLLRVVRSASYVGFAVPTFVAALALFFVAVRRLDVHTLDYAHDQTVFTVRNLVALTLPASVLTVKLLAVQLRYARSESVEIFQEDFVRTLRSTGASTTALAKHVLKNGAPSLLSLFFSELVSVMFVVVVVVEVIFDIPGFGQLLYQGIENRDINVILATTVFPILLVMFGNLLQDVAYSVVDPRIDQGGDA